VNKKLEKARADAIRESFRLGGAMADLQRASDELKAVTIQHEIDFDDLPTTFRVIEGQPCDILHKSAALRGDQ
jgi:hypothetical protein